MRLLPDTHAALWLLDEDLRLSSRADRMLTEESNEVLLSAAVVWEVAIKRSLKKLEAPDGFAELLLEAGASPLAVSPDHAEAVAHLPWHHRDPFDRLLIAQARIGGVTLISADDRLRAYDVRVEW
ncbi:MAG TPA: type II toxin-antitoxin system VapC family toxin [Solirubrobacteraceae bacterium]|nr:type II toxin-antitoxin system VapC family toxin [Solirubrobacteraceae bacterium]